MKNSYSGPRDDNDSSRSSGLPVALASLILVILAFVATHAQARVVDVSEYCNASKDHYGGAGAWRDKRAIGSHARRSRHRPADSSAKQTAA